MLVLYWKQLKFASPEEVLAHRMIWSAVAVSIVVVFTRRLNYVLPVARSAKGLSIFFATGALIAANWFIFIWGVNNGFIIECSLGYFILPLFNVLLGVIAFQERPRPFQWLAIGFAGVGVFLLVYGYGQVPWVAFGLTLTFGIYGLIRKVAPLGALDGLFLESILMFLPAIIYLSCLDPDGRNSFFSLHISDQLLLMASGPITALPLLLFATAARKVSLSVLGIMQYLAPTLQLAIGVFVYAEPFTQQHLLAFSAIWTALAIYSVEGFIRQQHQRAVLKLRT